MTAQGVPTTAAGGFITRTSGFLAHPFSNAANLKTTTLIFVLVVIVTISWHMLLERHIIQE